MKKKFADRLRTTLVVGVVAVLWEVAGRAQVGGVRVFPALSGILVDYVASGEVYTGHVLATVRTASAGLAIGTAAAVVAALAFCLFPRFERIFHGVNIALFALPSIALGPLLVLVFDGTWPQTVLSAAMVYYPVMAAVLVGLRDIDPRHVDLVRSYGGGTTALMRFVRLRNALPSAFAGLRVGASLAVLGAILGEFGSGQRWGLGTFLLGSLGQADANRLWGIGIASAAIALIGYGVFALLGNRFARSTTQVTISAKTPGLPVEPSKLESRSKSYATTVASIVMPFFLWWAILKVARLSPIVAPDPFDTFQYLFLQDTSAESRRVLLDALGQTVPLALAGLFAGLFAAFLLAATTVVAPRLNRTILPLAMVLQNTPLVALTPLVLLLLGRGTAACLAMAILVVFFPAYVLLAQGFSLVPRAAREVVAAYGGGRFKQLFFVHVPYSRQYLLAAAKLVAPRALLGVMVAEWLLTGTGLGNLMDVSRGTLDYGMIWSGAVASILLSVLAYEAIVFAERVVR